MSSAQAQLVHDTLSCDQRGWRFFLWPSGSAEGETQIDGNHPYARLLISLERQIADKVLAHGARPLDDIDVCISPVEFKTGEHGSCVGSCVINCDERIQLMLYLTAERLSTDKNHFIQTLAHEYGHGLFQRAFFEAHGNGHADYSENNAGIVEQIKVADVIASEALADAFALSVHNVIEIGTDDPALLPYERLSESDDYDRAYSLKVFLCSFLTSSPTHKQFIYNSLFNREQNPQWGLLQCLERAVENDADINPEGLSMAKLYEQFRVNH